MGKAKTQARSEVHSELQNPIVFQGESGTCDLPYATSYMPFSKWGFWFRYRRCDRLKCPPSTSNLLLWDASLANHATLQKCASVHGPLSHPSVQINDAIAAISNHRPQSSSPCSRHDNKNLPLHDVFVLVSIRLICSTISMTLSAVSSLGD